MKRTRFCDKSHNDVNTTQKTKRRSRIIHSGDAELYLRKKKGGDYKSRTPTAVVNEPTASLTDKIKTNVVRQGGQSLPPLAISVSSATHPMDSPIILNKNTGKRCWLVLLGFLLLNWIYISENQCPSKPIRIIPVDQSNINTIFFWPGNQSVTPVYKSRVSLHTISDGTTGKTNR